MNEQFLFELMATLNTKKVKNSVDKLEKSLKADPIMMDLLINETKSLDKTKKSVETLALKLKDVLKLELSDKEIISVINTAIKKTNTLANTMGKYREQSELARKSEEKRQKLAQNKAINNTLEKEYETATKIKSLMSVGSIDANVIKATSQYDKLSNVTTELQTDFSNLISLQNKLGTSKTDKELIKNYSEFNNTLKKVNNQLSIVKSNQVKIKNEKLFDLSKQNSLSGIDAYLTKNTNLSKELRNKILQIKQAVETCDDSQALKNLQKEFTITKNKAEALGKTGRSIGDELKNNFKKFTSWVGISFIFFGAQRIIKNMVQDVIDINTAMTSLKKVTEATDASFEKFLKNATYDAKDLGAAISDIINSTAEFARLGYSLPEAEELGRVATLYKNVGDGINATDASQTIVSSMHAFNIEAKDSIKIIDSINNVSNNFAISSKGIGEALMASASAMSSANNSLEETISLITTANTIVQNPQSVGVGLKTLSLRLRSTRSEIEEMGEDADGAAENVSKLRDLLLSLTKGKVDIQIDKDTYKSTYQIMLEMSKVWKDMNDMSQASALEAMFGKRQANIGASILQNGKILEKSLKSAQDSQNSALREQEKYEKSVQYSLDRLKASTQELASITISDKNVKGVVDLINEIINLTSAVGGLVPILTAVGIGFGLWKIAIPVLSSMHIAMLSVASGATSATVAQMSWNTALTAFKALNPAGQIMLIVSAISLLVGITSSVKSLTVSLEDAQQAYAEVKEELENVNDEFKTTSDRIDELNSKDKLTFVEKDELSNLIKTNNELERRKRLLEAEKALKTEELDNKLKEQYTRDFTHTYGHTDNEYKKYASSDYRKKKETGVGYTLVYIFEEEYLERVKKRFIELNKKTKEFTDKEAEEFSELKKYLVDTAKKYQDLEEQAYSPETKKLFTDITKGVDQALFPDLWKKDKLEEVFNKTDFKGIKDELITLSKAGKLDENIIKNYKLFNTELSKIGVTAEDVVIEINNISNSTNKYSDNLVNVTTELENVKNKSDDFNNSISSLSSAYNTLSNNENISTEALLKLIDQFPEYANELANINDNKQDGIDLIKRLYEVEKQETVEELENIKKKIEAEKELYETKQLLNPNLEYKPISNMGLITSFNKNYDNMLNELAEAKKKKDEERVKELEESLSVIDAKIKALKDSSLNDGDNGGGGKGNSIDVWKEAFQAEYNYLRYLRDKDQVNSKEYYDKLTQLNNKYFANRKKYVDEFRKYDLELYKLDQELAEKRISDLKFNLQLKINTYGEENTKNEQIRTYTQIQDELHKLADKERQRAKDLNVSENKELLEDLSNQWWNYEQKKLDISKAYQSKQQSLYEGYISATERMQDLVLSMEKKKLEAQRNTHDEAIKAIKDEFDYKKSLLDEELDEHNYNNELQNRINKINKLQHQIDLIKNDDSNKAKLKQLEDELAKAMTDLNEFQYKHGIDTQKDFLDEQEKNLIEEHQSEIDLIDEKLNDEVYMHELADKRIKDSGYKLYSDLMKFSEKYGTVSKHEVEEIWREYEKVIEKFDISQNGVTATLNTLYGKLSNIKDLLKQMSNMSLGEFHTYSNNKTKEEILSDMQSNSKAWFNADSKGKERIKQDNIDLANMLYELYGIKIEPRPDGHWYYKDTNKRVYHKGGFVSNSDANSDANKFKSIKTLRDDEVELVAQTGELILSRNGTANFIDNIVTLTDIASNLKNFDIPDFNSSDFDVNRNTNSTVKIENKYNITGNTSEELLDNMNKMVDKSSEKTIKEITETLGIKNGNIKNTKNQY